MVSHDLRQNPCSSAGVLILIVMDNGLSQDKRTGMTRSFES